MLIFDPGVVSDGVQPETWRALGFAEACYKVLASKDCVVTALVNGLHNPGSLHARGFAADISIRNLTAEQHSVIFLTMKATLFPQGYDVVDEKMGATPATTGSHFHIEFDPKPGRDEAVRRLSVT